MSNEPNPDDLKSLWQNQEVEKVTITIDEIRRRAARFERRIYWRNLREYIAGAVAIAVLLFQYRYAHGRQILAVLLMIAGTLLALVQLHRRGSARTVPADAGLRVSLAFHRAELERQRDALRQVWLWYLLPFVPGFVATLVVAAMARGITTWLIIFGVMLVIFLTGVWRLNEWAARKLDRKIQELRAMETDDE